MVPACRRLQVGTLQAWVTGMINVKKLEKRGYLSPSGKDEKHTVGIAPWEDTM